LLARWRVQQAEESAAWEGRWVFSSKPLAGTPWPRAGVQPMLETSGCWAAAQHAAELSWLQWALEDGWF